MKSCIYFDHKDWPIEVAELIDAHLFEISKKKSNVNIMLTGGRSVVQIYRELNKLNITKYFEYADIFLSDERVVSASHEDSNYNLISRELFNRKIPSNTCLHSVDILNQDRKLSAIKYHSELPNWFDLILLSLGEDGHIASLFPYKNIHSDHYKYAYIGDIGGRYLRFSATHHMLNRSDQTLILVVGKNKNSILKSIFMSKDVNKYPSLNINGANYLVIKNEI